MSLDVSNETKQSTIDKAYRINRLRVMFAITFGYGAYYTCRLGLSVVKKPLIDEGIFTPDDLGKIGAAIFYGYAFGKFTNGFIADHVNIRKMFSLGLLLSAVCNLAAGFSASLTVFCIVWGLNGWFQGFGATSSVVALSNWFSNHERGRYYGIWSSAHSIGEALTFIGTASLVAYLGWQAGFLAPALFCLVVAVIVYLIMKDRPASVGLPPIAEWKKDHGVMIEDPKASTWKAQLHIFKYPSVWIICMASTMMYITRYAINSWGMLYLQEARGYSTVEAGSIMGVNTIAGIAGCIAYGFLSDKLFKARRPPATLLFGLLEILSLIALFYIPAGHPVILTFAFAVYGFTLSGLLAVLGGLFAVDIVSKKASGAVLGFVGVFSYLGAAFQERVSGYLIDKNSTVVGEIRNYDFSQAIVFWLGASVISMLLATLLWNVKASD